MLRKLLFATLLLLFLLLESIWISSYLTSALDCYFSRERFCIRYGAYRGSGMIRFDGGPELKIAKLPDFQFWGIRLRDTSGRGRPATPPIRSIRCRARSGPSHRGA